MNKISYYVLVFLLLSTAFCYGINVEKGQIWATHYDDPFKISTNYYLVLDVKDEWVKYVNLKRDVTDDSNYRSDKIETFISIRELVEKGDPIYERTFRPSN